ncbi:MAG: NlpC/P60 family protein, partial [Novibacillus thermophilus]
VEVSQPDPVETPQPELPETGSDELPPSEPVQPEPVQPVNPQPVESQPDPEQETEAGHSSVADKIIKTGEKYLGTPYKYGAPYGQTNTFDCSSFTKTVFAENGITLPRSSRQQAQVGTPVSKNNLQKGDLIFTSTSYSSNISHVAIYAGNGKVLHTYGPGGVRYDTFKGSWLDRAFITARRVID